jgi:hypothetical protein
MNGPYYSMIGQEMGSVHTAFASRNAISNFLLHLTSQLTPLFVPYTKSRNTNDSWFVESLLRGADRIDLTAVRGCLADCLIGAF